MEHYEQNFKQWLQENYPSDQQGKYLNSEFLQILRDILRGIDYLHRVKKRCHGKLSETNIVIVNGRAKITGMSNMTFQQNLSCFLPTSQRQNPAGCSILKIIQFFYPN